MTEVEAAQSKHVQMLADVQQDIKVSSQIASRLLTSIDNMPQIYLGQPVDLDIVPNLKMLYLCKVEDQPSPLMLRITYQGPKSLSVVTTLSETVAKDIVFAKEQNLETAKKMTQIYGKNVQFYLNPERIYLSTSP